MSKYKIVYDKNECIGAGECEALAPQMWKVNNKGKAELNGSVEENGKWVLEFDESEYDKQKDICDSCPADCIKIEKV